MQPNIPQTPDSQFSTSPSRLAAGISRALRKFGPYALFFLLGIAMLWGPFVVHSLTEFVHGARATSDALGNATGAEVAADAQAAGWPAFGLVTGKLITAAGAFLFMSILLWLSQQLTHPAPSAWAKKGYSADFDSLPAGPEKFAVYQRLRLHLILLGAASLVFAALVQ